MIVPLLSACRSSRDPIGHGGVGDHEHSLRMLCSPLGSKDNVNHLPCPFKHHAAFKGTVAIVPLSVRVWLEWAGKVIHVDPWSQGDNGIPQADMS